MAPPLIGKWRCLCPFIENASMHFCKSTGRPPPPMSPFGICSSGWIAKPLRMRSVYKQAQQLTTADLPLPCFATDGKVLSGSLQRLEDQRAQQLLSVFAHHDKLVLGHYDIDRKSNEIPAAQRTIQQLDLGHCLYTMDAMHCQKNTGNRAETRG